MPLLLLPLLAGLLAAPVSGAPAAAPPPAATPAAAPDNAAGNTVTVKKLTVAHFAHSLADDQFKAPGEHALPNAFDGDPATVWYVPKAGLGAPGYTVEVTLAKPVQFDQVRVLLDSPVPLPAGTPAPGRLSSVELGFWDHSLSAKFPIYKRTLALPTDRPSADLGLPQPMKWNPQLINDDEFGDKRREKGLGDIIPFPMTINALSLVVREAAVGAGPPTVADVALMLHGQPLPVVGSAELKAKHRAFIESGLKHILEGRYLVGKDRTLFFEKGGLIYDIAAADWTAGRADGKNRKKAGLWRIADARFEAQGLVSRKYEPVEYALDDAPTRVELKGRLLGGEYAVATRAPTVTPAAEPAPQAPTLGSTPGYEPLLVE